MATSEQSPNASSAAETPRYVCIHGHFYQPPRENPWLETVEVQDSAAPYHDWNDRITAECYAPNGASRITDKENKIVRIMNNYSWISFNFGPTLLSWLNDFAPRTYRMILDADRSSAQHNDGHGSAMAQVYNHVIMPLANERDARTQIRWGISDFMHRFGRRPEGMWLAETAASRAVLDLMAQEGILFTILAPNQCARVRPLQDAIDPTESESSLEGTPWTETPDASVDTRHPYRIELDEGRSIAVFFYNGPNSRAIAFEGLLNSGVDFAKRLVAGLGDESEIVDGEPALLSNVATDGESYGHHHRHGEMALSYAIHWLEDEQQIPLINYAAFLAKYPPSWGAEIVDDTSWSCAHGVERWRSNCGCNSGRPGWNQEWRTPLRVGLDQLRDATIPLAEKLSKKLFKDLWVARDAYISVILDRSRPNIDAFFDTHATHELSQTERITALELMELERHAQLMYTSCGWFFDEVSGIETVQVIAYAARVLQLAARLFGKPGEILEAGFLGTLATATSNLPEIGNGAEVYKRFVTGMKIGLEEVGAHYAISSIFRSYPEQGELFCYNVRRQSHQVFSSGRGRVALGAAWIDSRITEETEEICFAVLHLGDQNLSAAVKRYDSSDPAQVKAFETFCHDVAAAMRRAKLPEVIRLIDQLFGGMDYSLLSLFADEQHRILQAILTQTVAEMEISLSKIYEDHTSLLDFLTDCGMAPPPALEVVANYAIGSMLRRAIESENFEPDHVLALAHRATAEHIFLNAHELGYAAGQRMKRAMVRLEAAASGDEPASKALTEALVMAETFRQLPFEVNFWQAQNIWNDLLRRSDRSYWTDEWWEAFRQLGEAMNIRVDQLVTEEEVSVF
jgi:alpha-amylase/alpha-mannosidase (GH57 family)